jgi:uncharacterized protein involved in exopolysaccharide biosynthesis
VYRSRGAIPLHCRCGAGIRALQLITCAFSTGKENSMNMQETLLQDQRAGGAASDGAPMGIDFLRVLRRHYRGLLVTMALVLGVAVVALLVIEPRYQATAVMQVDTDDIDLSDSAATATSVARTRSRRRYSS